MNMVDITLMEKFIIKAQDAWQEKNDKEVIRILTDVYFMLQRMKEEK